MKKIKFEDLALNAFSAMNVETMSRVKGGCTLPDYTVYTNRSCSDGYDENDVRNDGGRC